MQAAGSWRRRTSSPVIMSAPTGRVRTRAAGATISYSSTIDSILICQPQPQVRAHACERYHRWQISRVSFVNPHVHRPVCVETGCGGIGCLAITKLHVRMRDIFFLDFNYGPRKACSLRAVQCLDLSRRRDGANRCQTKSLFHKSLQKLQGKILYSI